MKYVRLIHGLHVVVAVMLMLGTIVRADFSRYEVILERRPFGEAPAEEPEPEPEPEQDTGPSFADEMRLVAMTISGGDVRVGLVDGNVSPARTYYLFVGEEEDGLRVVSADYDDELVLVERDGDQRTLRMGGSGSTAGRATAGPGMIGGGASREGRSRDESRRRRTRGHITEGRRQRMEEEERRREQEPELTGAVLDRHLQEYNVHAIREGMPPLPIPLTEEQDAQLVEEGVLPPQ